MGRKHRKSKQEQPILATHVVLYDEGETFVASPSDPPAAGLSGSWGVCMNVLNSIVGAGVIAIPHAMADGGFLPVMMLLILGALLTMYSMNVIVSLGDLHQADTFEGLAKVAFGYRGFLVVCFFQFVFSFGANCSYLLVIGDTLPPLVGHLMNMSFANGSPIATEDTPLWLSVLTSRNYCVTLIAVGILFPICMQKNFASLSKFAGLSIVGVIFCGVCILYKCIAQIDSLPLVDSGGTYYDYIAIHHKVFPAIGTIAFAYVCQHQTYLVYNSMLDKSPQHFAYVSKWSVAASFFVILLFGIPGYLMFLKDTHSDIFLNFTDHTDRLIQACRLITVLGMILTFPGEFMVARYTLQILLEGNYKTNVEHLFLEQDKRTGMFDPEECIVSPTNRSCLQARGQPISAFSPRWHFGLTVVLIIAIVTLSLADPNLGDITSLTGSFSAVALAFILPAACHLRLGVPPEVHSKWHDHYVPWLTIIFGSIAFVVSTTMSIINIIQHTAEINT
ncbi:hypothetical protein THRCLA_20289 [Thraustotheca clavata]|uniref:Amino acid transporter transmembrane domain-containing protein n=1 Tax=Thraustotheca clavata TaxID=74557 RepID=A0A1W0A8Z2_9STRA|nr:hypothetical protein THRCLA_20289 [Thraustotheca clavata]